MKMRIGLALSSPSSRLCLVLESVPFRLLFGDWEAHSSYQVPRWFRLTQLPDTDDTEERFSRYDPVEGRREEVRGTCTAGCSPVISEPTNHALTYL